MSSFMGGELTQLPFQAVSDYIMGLTRLFHAHEIYPQIKILTEGNYEGKEWDDFFASINDITNRTVKLHEVRQEPVVPCGGVNVTVNRYTYRPRVVRNIWKLAETASVNIGFTYDDGLEPAFFDRFFSDLGEIRDQYTFSLSSRKRMDTLEIPICAPTSIIKALMDHTHRPLYANSHDDGSMCKRNGITHRVILNPNGTIVPDPMFPADPKSSRLLQRFDEVRTKDVESLQQLEATDIYRWSKDIINTYGERGRCPIELWIEENQR